MEYRVDTVQSFTPSSLSFALPAPQLACLIEEGAFKAAWEMLDGGRLKTAEGFRYGDLKCQRVELVMD